MRRDIGRHWLSRCFVLRRYQDAIKAVDEMITVSDNQNGTLECAIVALCYLRLGSRDEAKTWYEKATDKARGQEEQGSVVHDLLDEVQSGLQLPVPSESLPRGQE